MNYRAQVYAVFIFLVFGLLIFFPRPGLPKATTYDKALRFDEIRAFYDLEHLAQAFPSRLTGSDAYKGAADWVSAEFTKMGLTPVVESFATVGLRDAPIPLATGLLGKVAPMRATPGCEIYQLTTGINITAVSPGTGAAGGGPGSAEGDAGDSIIVFAHLDTVPMTQGADDNASGVAAVLELARVFASEEHRSTMVFVILAAEESGLQGSRDWVARHLAADKTLTIDGRSYGPVRLALGLDCVAWTNGTLPAVYSLSSGANRCEPGVVSVVKAAMDKQLPRWWSWRVRLRTQAAEEHGGSGLSDQAAFLGAGVSSLCLGRSDLFGDLSPYTNSAADTLDTVNSQILGRSGDMAETILRTVEASGPALGITGQAKQYLFHRYGWTPGWMMTAAAVLLAVFLAVVGAPFVQGGTRAVREAVWYVAVILVAVGLSIVSWVENGFFLEPPTVFRTWLLIGVVCLVGLAAARHALVGGRDNKRVSDTLCIVLAVWCLVGLWTVGPVWVVYTLLGPVLAVPQFRGGWVLDKTLYRMVLLGWAGTWLWNLAKSFAGGAPPSGFECFASRAWLIGLGLIVFPTVWQATARRGSADMTESQRMLQPEPPVRLRFPTFRRAR